MTNIAVITVPHSGTHFMRDFLLKDHVPASFVSHCFPSTRDHWTAEAAKADLVIVPLRHPLDIAKSWINRERRLAEELPEYLAEMERFVGQFDVATLPIDLPVDRKHVLGEINAAYGLSLDPGNWPVIRQPEAYPLPGRRLTAAEESQVPLTDPFSRHYGPWIDSDAIVR